MQLRIRHRSPAWRSGKAFFIPADEFLVTPLLFFLIYFGVDIYLASQGIALDCVVPFYLFSSDQDIFTKASFMNSYSQTVL
jgi:hypothetical protein